MEELLSGVFVGLWAIVFLCLLKRSNIVAEKTMLRISDVADELKKIRCKLEGE